MLKEILERADRRAAEASADVASFRAAVGTSSPARGFTAALSRPGLSVIAEIKRRSPSAGDIDSGLDPVRQAKLYQAGGADAISVLTEPHFFGGSLRDLEQVRDAVDIPVLRKDFTRNEAQVWEARAAGADALLLIVAALSQDVLARLLHLAADIGIDALVEVHTELELDRAVSVGAELVGVNNRDLATFTTDLAVAEGLSDGLVDVRVRVAESGVSSVEGAARMSRAGYDAILVGESLVRHDDPAGFVASLKAAT